jgi:hypothetical protein
MKNMICVSVVFAWLLAAILLSSGCTTVEVKVHKPAAASSDATARSSAATTVEDFPRAVTVAFCEHYTRCCGIPEERRNTALCEQIVGDGAGGYNGLETFEASLSTGNVTLDPALASMCLSGQFDTSCDVTTAEIQTALFAACFGALTGHVTTGGACLTAAECANGWCDAGTCAPFRALGTSCSVDVECSRLGVGDAWCAAGTCSSLSADGTSCTLNQHCLSGLCNYPVCGQSIPTTDRDAPIAYTCDGYTLPAPDGGP